MVVDQEPESPLKAADEKKEEMKEGVEVEEQEGEEDDPEVSSGGEANQAPVIVFEPPKELNSAEENERAYLISYIAARYDPTTTTRVFVEVRLSCFHSSQLSSAQPSQNS